MVTASIKDYTMFVGGEWVSGSGGAMEILNPATEEIVHRVPRASREDVDGAVRGAREGFAGGRWSGLGGGARACCLWKRAELLERRTAALAALETAETGKPITVSRDAGLPFPIDNLRFF